MRKILILLVILSVLLLGCAGRERSEGEISVLVFITGVTAGSPTYEMLAEAALQFAEENPSVKVRVYEAGFNQALWEQQLAEMVSTGQFDIVLGSNPSLPELAANVALIFPEQKFIILDAHMEGHPQIRTFHYNQYEQGLFLGYLAGLVTTSDMPHANDQRRIGFIAAQEFPLLTRYMIPGFLEGARLVDPQIELDVRIIGSWADATRAAQLTSAMIDSGVDVFTSIAGGAAQGLFSTIRERGAYAVSFNTNQYSLAPGYIVGSGFLNVKPLVTRILEDIKSGNIQFGISESVGIREGFIDFIFDDPLFIKSVPFDIRQRFEIFMDYLRSRE